MSRAGKFIPGGAGRKTGAIPGARTGPIRAPAGTPGGGEPPKPDKKPLFGKGLGKQVPKNRQLPITVMSAVTCCVLVSFAWYMFKVAPMQQALADEQAASAAKAKADADALAALQAQQAAAAKAAASARVTLSVDSSPGGATVTVVGQQKQTPAIFNDLAPGTISVLVQAPGYEDNQQSVTLASDKPPVALMVQLVPQAGNLALDSPQTGVSYTLTGPNNYEHEGVVPDHLDGVPAGDYQLVAALGDWKLPPMTITVHDRDQATQVIKFPFGTVHLDSTPPGATVRNGHTVVGTTPLDLTQQKPGAYRYSVDLAPNEVQWVDANLPPFGTVNQAVTLSAGKNFIAACGLPMMWIPDGFWAAKYLMPQNEFENVAKYNPSSFRKPNRPVETISWENANAFCKKLTAYEQAAGRLPAGFHYALPSETQWSSFSDDANIDLAAMSRIGSLNSTQDVGYSEPNKYGLYDTLGNVWEWCSDIYDASGAHSMRGGCWLSSPENFPGPDTRTAAAPGYPGDHFTGFRVVLVPD
jgi:formylglycine-generating enzyme required for sulfatase activity